jgi:predicted acylesterase/phospholipase RssA
MTLENTSTSPFGNIALCLSGGGYRAATFGLGTIDMLELVGLLDDVKLMSTVSGGTFTGVTYALSVADGKPYGLYYDEFYSFLRDTNCVELALKHLYKTPSPSGRNDLSLIRSAAMVYDTRLFAERGRTFESLQKIVGDGKRFLELIHNATEFRKGNSFRFRASHNPNVLAGNGDFKVKPEIASRVLLADVIAASSCFPGAFEPIRFPDDFVWSDGVDTVRDQLKQDVTTPVGRRRSGFNIDGKCLSLPLMDGGIYDNQGISNAMEADGPKGERFAGLFLISDTSARDDDMLRYPKPDERAGWLSMNMLFWGAVGLFATSVVSTAFLVYYLVTAVDTRTLSWPRFIFQYLWPIAMFLVLIGLLIWGYRLFQKNKEIVVSGAKFKLWPVVRRLSLPDLINMVKARVTSLGTMAGDVFMKRVRQLEFNDAM